MTSGRVFPLPFSAGVYALAPVLQNEIYCSLKTEERLFHGKKRSGNRLIRLEEGDWKIPQGRSPPGNLLPGRAGAKYSIFINNRL
jgi:hypothetical protein